MKLPWVWQSMWTRDSKTECWVRNSQNGFCAILSLPVQANTIIFRHRALIGTGHSPEDNSIVLNESQQNLNIIWSNLSKCPSNVLLAIAFAYQQPPHQSRAQWCHSLHQLQFEQNQLLLRHTMSEKRWWKISSVVNIILKWQNTCNEWATRIWWSCPSIEIHLENKVFKFSFNISNCSVLSFTSSASITPTLNQNFNTFYQTKLITTNFKLKYFRFQQKKFIPKIRISTRLIFSLSEQK